MRGSHTFFCYWPVGCPSTGSRAGSLGCTGRKLTGQLMTNRCGWRGLVTAIPERCGWTNKQVMLKNNNNLKKKLFEHLPKAPKFIIWTKVLEAYLYRARWEWGTLPGPCQTPPCWWRLLSRTGPRWGDLTAFSTQPHVKEHTRQGYCNTTNAADKNNSNLFCVGPFCPFSTNSASSTQQDPPLIAFRSLCGT